MSGKRKAPAGPAAAAAGERKSQRSGSRSSAGKDPPDDAADKRLAADLKKAEDASRRESYVRVASTEGLWMWGKDHGGWDLPESASRDEVIDALVKLGAVAVGSQAALEKNWRRHAGARANETAPLDEEGDPDPEDEEGGAPPPPPPPPPKDAKPASSADAAAAAAASANPASATTESLAGPLRACGLCGGHQHSVIETFKCLACGMNNAHGFDHEMNVWLRGLKSGVHAPASGGSSISGQSQITANKVSKRDEEFKRQAQEGDPYPRFEEKGAFTPEQAFRVGRGSFLATDYAPSSEWLTKLVQSGKLTQVGATLPVPLSQVAREREQQGGDAMLILRDGRLTQSSSIEVAPLNSMRDLVTAFVSTIGPALIQQPAALSDWFSMLRSVVNVEKDTGGWPAARKFLHDTLADSVNRRAPFGAYDPRILDAVTRWSRAQGGAPAPAQQPGRGPPGGAAPQGHVDAKPECCKDWNFGRCSRASCNRLHECMWLACTAADKKHAGMTCAQRPPPVSRVPIPARSGGGGKFPPPPRR